MIEKSVRSALDQDYPILEMFFMDDASSDGSGDTMEAIVRQYRGRHKVSVVRNDENQYITGQWNIVSKLATGEWFGMFCGDDVAYVNRVSLVAARIKQFPYLHGVSTSAIEVDPRTGECTVENGVTGDSLWATREMDARALRKCFKPYGATSFWRRSLFDRPIPKVPLDDDYLLFRAFARNYKTGIGPFFLYDASLKTIEYSAGIGVCAQGMSKCRDDLSKTALWRHNIKYNKRFLAIACRTMELALENECTGRNDEFALVFRIEALKKRICSTSTWGRLCLIPLMVRLIFRQSIPKKEKNIVLRLFIRQMVVEFFGLYVGSILRSVVFTLQGRKSRI